MTIDEILSHLSDEDANVVQRAISQNMKLNVFQAAFKTLLQIRSGLIYYDIL